MGVCGRSFERVWSWDQPSKAKNMTVPWMLDVWMVSWMVAWMVGWPACKSSTARSHGAYTATHSIIPSRCEISVLFMARPENIHCMRRVKSHGNNSSFLSVHRHWDVSSHEEPHWKSNQNLFQRWLPQCCICRAQHAKLHLLQSLESFANLANLFECRWLNHVTTWGGRYYSKNLKCIGKICICVYIRSTLRKKSRNRIL